MFKKVILLLSMCIFLVSCEIPDYSYLSETTPRNSSAAKPQYSLVGGLGTLLYNQWFSFKVNDLSLHYEINGNIPESVNYSLLRMNITVSNITNDILPIGAGDFYLSQGNEVIKPLKDIVDGQFPISQNLDSFQSLTGDLFFKVPYGQIDFALQYTETFESGKAGNTYTVILNTPLQNPSARLSEIKRNTSFDEYVIKSMGELISVKGNNRPDFEFSVNSFERVGDILEIKIKIINSFALREMSFYPEWWSLFVSKANGVGETLTPLAGEGYMTSPLNLPADAAYEIKLGFAVNDNDAYLLEINNYNTETLKTSVFGIVVK